MLQPHWYAGGLPETTRKGCAYQELFKIFHGILLHAEMQTQMEEERAVAAQEIAELTNYLAAAKADLDAQHQKAKSHIFSFIEAISR
jgi:hypothetical protein